jgi:hypothetical protein
MRSMQKLHLEGIVELQGQNIFIKGDKVQRVLSNCDVCKNTLLLQNLIHGYVKMTNIIPISSVSLTAK